MEKKEKKGIKSTVLKVILVLCVLGLGITIGIGDYAHTEIDIEKFNSEKHSYNVEYEEEEYMAYIPDGADKGLILYPGGNIEFTAYAELMDKIAQKGIMCIAVSMPYNMPILGTDTADKYIEKYQNIDEWYLAGHDKGGTCAARYVAKTDKVISGLALIASYSKTDLTDMNDLKTVIMYGTSDAVISMINYNKCLKNLPEGYIEEVISGANHSNYGNYELNKEDAIAKITRDEQIDKTAEIIYSMISK